MSLRWLFRVASTPEVGGGHMSRCLALAKALVKIEEKADPLFILDQGGDAWVPAVSNAGFDVVLDGDEPQGLWVGGLMDGYHFTDADATHLKVLTNMGPLVVIEDMFKPRAYADLIVNSGYCQEQEELAGCVSLLGPRYALLGAEYQNMPLHQVKNDVQTVLVSFGRVDSKNATDLVLAALAQLLDGGAKFETSVVLGGGAPHRSSIAQSILTFPGPIELLIDIDDMSDRLGRSDLSIGGGGVSLMERMAAGVPSITIMQADNQALSTESVANLGATLNAGGVEELTVDDLASRVKKLLESRKLRDEMSRTARMLVDGRGAERVAKHMIEIVTQRVCNQ